MKKAIREKAAMACSARASDWAVGLGGLDFDESYTDDETARDLAVAAFVTVPNEIGDFDVQWAEAEALLRTGWTP